VLGCPVAAHALLCTYRATREHRRARPQLNSLLTHSGRDLALKAFRSFVASRFSRSVRSGYDVCFRRFSDAAMLSTGFQVSNNPGPSLAGKRSKTDPSRPVATQRPSTARPLANFSATTPPRPSRGGAGPGGGEAGRGMWGAGVGAEGRGPGGAGRVITSHRSHRPTRRGAAAAK